MRPPRSHLIYWLTFPAITMSLGWGLRGFIGGGPLGAMIPGALVALALCLLLRRDDDDAALVAAFGAVGIGFGGQMTYGQTIGLSFVPETSWFGLTGLALKGAIWGLLGGAIVGLALKVPNPRRVVAGFGLMVAGTWIGWKFFNEPKIIYFSNRVDQPRPEIWFGLLLGALLMLVWCRSAVAWRFAGWAALGGGIGFGVGGWFQVVGRPLNLEWVSWWKLMEFTFGFCFGWALGYAAWRERARLEPLAPVERRLGATLSIVLAAVVVGGGLWVAEHWRMRFTYTVVGAGLMALALWRPRFGWHIAITMTFCAFVIDYFEYVKAPNWPVVVVLTAAVAWAVARWPRALPLFLLLLWTANLDSYFKSWANPKPFQPAHLIVEGVFTLFGIGATIAAWRLQASRDAQNQPIVS